MGGGGGGGVVAFTCLCVVFFQYMYNQMLLLGHAQVNEYGYERFTHDETLDLYGDGA